MKKVLLIFLTVVFVSCAITGCGGFGNDNKDSAASEIESVESADTLDSGSGDKLLEAAETSQGERENDVTYDMLPVSDEDLPLEKCVELGKYKGLKLEKKIYEITDKDVDDRIEADIKKPVTELNDEWIAANTPFENIGQLKDQLRLEMEEQNKSKSESELYADAWNEVLNSSRVNTLLASYVEDGKKFFKALMKSYLKTSGYSMKEYLDSTASSEEDLEERAEDYGRKMAAQAEVLYLIAEKEGIKDNDKEVKKYKKQLLKSSGYDSFKELYADYGEAYIVQTALTRRIGEVICSYAEITEVVQ